MQLQITRSIAAAPLLLLLSGCGGSAVDSYHARAGRLLDAPVSADCSATLPPFGVSLFEGLYEPDGSMKVENDGRWCSLGVSFAYGTPSRIDVVQAPQHGELTIAKIAEGARLNYRPTASYVGLDMFSARADVGGRTWTIPVAVVVTR